MRKNFGAKPWTYPQPVFIVATYDGEGNPDAMNAAWGGIDYDDQINLCLSVGHKTVKNLLETKAFTVSIGTADQLTACDYVGIVSANDVPDKFFRAGFHAVKSEFVNAPLIEELPMAVECELVSYDPEMCHLVGKIVNVSADERRYWLWASCRFSDAAFPVFPSKSGRHGNIGSRTRKKVRGNGKAPSSARDIAHTASCTIRRRDTSVWNGCPI